MVAELRNYQSQVNAYRFEIERIEGQIKETREHYFQMKQQENMGMIQEMDENQEMENMDP